MIRYNYRRLENKRLYHNLGQNRDVSLQKNLLRYIKYIQIEVEQNKWNSLHKKNQNLKKHL